LLPYKTRRESPTMPVFQTRSQTGTPSERYGTVTTTLPRLCPLSTYLCASTMSSSA